MSPLNPPLSLAAATSIRRPGWKKPKHVLADVYRSGGSWMVGFREESAPEIFDEAGPFDDEDEAVDAARRGADVVAMSPVNAHPYRLGDRGAE